MDAKENGGRGRQIENERLLLTRTKIAVLWCGGGSVPSDITRIRNTHAAISLNFIIAFPSGSWMMHAWMMAASKDGCHGGG